MQGRPSTSRMILSRASLLCDHHHTRMSKCRQCQVGLLPYASCQPVQPWRRAVPRARAAGAAPSALSHLSTRWRWTRSTQVRHQLSASDAHVPQPRACLRARKRGRQRRHARRKQRAAATGGLRKPRRNADYAPSARMPHARRSWGATRRAQGHPGEARWQLSCCGATLRGAAHDGHDELPRRG